MSILYGKSCDENELPSILVRVLLDETRNIDKMHFFFKHVDKHEKNRHLRLNKYFLIFL